MKSCTFVTTSGIITHGFEMQGRFGDHAWLHDLCFDLAEPGLQRPPPRTFRYQYASTPPQVVAAVAAPNQELLAPPVDTGANISLVEINLRLRQCGLGARLFRR